LGFPIHLFFGEVVTAKKQLRVRQNTTPNPPKEEELE